MIYQIVISELANADIDFIFQYSMETFGLTVTEKYLNKLHDTIEDIRKMSTRGQLHADLKPYIRYHKVDSHYILYSYSQSTFHILRILHQNMDLRTISLE